MINAIYDITINDISTLTTSEIHVNAVKHDYNKHAYNKFMLITNLVSLCVDHGHLESSFEILDLLL